MGGVWLVLVLALSPGVQGGSIEGVRALVDEARLAYEHADLEATRSYASEGIAHLLPQATDEAGREVAELLWDLGELARDSGALEDALRAHRSAVAILTRLLPEDDRDLLRIKLQLAATLWESGDVYAGRALDEEVLAAAERTLDPDDPFLLDARSSLGMALAVLGEWPRARELQESVVATMEENGREDSPDLELARSNLSVTLEWMGELDASRALMLTVLESREQRLPEQHPLLLVSRYNYAVSLSGTGDYAEARALIESVLRDYEETLPAEHPDLVRARDVLAGILVYMGELRAGQAILERVLEIRERTLPEAHPELQRNRTNLAACLSRQGDFEAARAIYESVLGVYEGTLPDGHPELLAARDGLATVLRGMGELEAARSLDEWVLEERERILPERHFEVVQSRINLAATLWHMGDLSSARELFEDALEVWETDLPAGHPGLLHARNNLALLLLGEGEAARACELLRGILLERESQVSAEDVQLIHLRSSLGVGLLSAGEPAAARAQLGPLASAILTRLGGLHSLSPREANGKALSLGQDLYAALWLSEIDEPQPQVAFEIAETRRHVSLPRMRQAVESAEVRELRVQMDEVSRRLNDLVATGRGGGSRAEVKQLISQRDLLGGAISTRLAASGGFTDSIRAPAVAAALGPAEVAVAFLAYRRFDFGEGTDEARRPRHMLAHLVFPDGTLLRVELGRSDRLQRLVEAWRESLNVGVGGVGRGVALSLDEPGGVVSRERTAGEALRRALLDPILTAVGPEGDTPTTLLVCPDDLVYFVPLDALPIGAERVGDRHRVVQLTSLAELVAPLPSVAGEPRFVALGGASFDAERAAAADRAEEPTESVHRSRAFEALDHTRGEVRALAALYERVWEQPPTLLVDGQATKEALRSGAVGARYLHVATHGWYEPENVASIEADRDPLAPDLGTLSETLVGMAPMTLCGLALAGANAGRDSLGRVPGILTAEELSNFDLSACELAVLSACETNVGVRRSGVGIQSLQAALRAAGARSSITSLWAVEDAATRRLMERFYAKLWTEELGPAEALWEAKLELREAGHPVRDWAGWVLTGARE